MSKTDKTRPWWVQMADQPGRTCVPVHDHRFGPCDLPAEAAVGRLLWTGARLRGCHWTGSSAFWVRRCESHGYREHAEFRREERRRSRHEARRSLRSYRSAD